MKSSVSPYQIVNGGKLKLASYDIEKYRDEQLLKKNLDSKQYGIIELLIIKALYKYQFLNMANLVRAINIALKPKLQKPKYDSNVRQLVKDGVIGKMYYEKDDGGTDIIVIYYLSYGAYQLVRENYPKLPITYQAFEEPNKLIEARSISEIMERLTLNQWHINLLSTYKSEIIEEGYFSKRRVGWRKVWFQSYFRIDMGKKKSLRIISLPCYKKEDGLWELMNSLLRIDESLAKTYETNAVIVVILCESLSQIETVVRDIHKYKQFKDTKTLFCIDMNTSKIRGLSGMYECTLEGNDVIFKNYSIKVPVVRQDKNKRDSGGSNERNKR